MGTEESAFTAWIKQRRHMLDLTQEDLADCVGCSRVTIQKIELGERRPSKQIALRLAECLRLPHDEQEAFLRFARGEARESGTAAIGGEPVLATAQPTSPLSSSTSSGYATPNNLLLPLTPLLGREQAVAVACDYLARKDTRLLTFTGAPGIGKTRLSLQVAAELLPQFEDGVFFVELAPVSDPSIVASTVASTLGLPESGSGSMLNALKNYLNGKKFLLVLDNFEQVLDAAPVALELLSSCPGLKVLITSREALHVPGEQQFPVSLLDLPDLARLPRVQALPGYAAIALFLERARAVDPAFDLNEDNALDVTTICTRLGGLPLAIELAAARVKFLSAAEMSARLDRQLSLLTGPAGHRRFRHMPARQQTMQAAIDWSYQLLEPAEQQLLVRLAVFVGGWTLEAAEAVFGQGSGATEGMESLLEKSLIHGMRNGSGESISHSAEHRFTMLESIREYALDRLEAGGEADEVRRLHAVYFLDLAERAEPHLTREEQAEWFQRLQREYTNVRAAISWSLAQGEHDISLRFGGALAIFWRNRYPGEGRWWAEWAMKGALKESAGEPTLTHARALFSAALMLMQTKEYPRARATFEESLRMYRALDDKLGIAASLSWTATMLIYTDLPEDRASVEKMLDESLELYRSIGDSVGMAGVLTSMGEAARMERDYPRAIDVYERCLALQLEVKDKQGIATTVTNLAWVVYHGKDYERAKHLLRETLRTYQEIGSGYYVAWALAAWAGIERAQGDPHKAAIVIAASNALAAPAGAPFDAPDQRDTEEIEAAIKSDLSEQEWHSAQQQGRTMNMDGAIDYALGA
jgi:predicted ATPase/transcriptional regulator with XRE-family HTH domain